MSVNLGTAYLQLEPSTDGLVPSMRKAFGGVEREAAKSGRQSGEEFADGAGKGTGGVKGLITKLGIIGLGLQAANQFAGEFSAGLEGAADLEQSKGAIAAIFKDDVGEIDDAAKQASTALGLSRNAYNELASTVGAGLKNKGIADYAGETQKLLGLGADLAAQFGGDTKTAVEAISSLMRGESDPIERYGVSINESAVAAELAATGQDKLTGAALEAAKAQARLDILMRQTVDSHGTFAAEADTVAGKQQRAGAQWEDLRTKIGEGFLPVVGAVTGFLSERLIPAIDGMVGAWQRGDGPIGKIRDIFTTIGGYLSSTFGPVVEQFSGIIRGSATPVFETLSRILRENVMPIFESVVGFVRDKIGPVISRVLGDVVLPAFRDVSGFITDRVLPVFEQIASFISEKVAPVVGDFADRVLIPAFEGIAKVAKWAWDTVLFPVLNGVWDIIENVVGPAVSWLWKNAFEPTFDAIGDAVESFGTNWARVWDDIKATAAAPVNFIIDTVWNDGLRKIINFVIGLVGGEQLAPAKTIGAPRDTSGYRHKSAGAGAFGGNWALGGILPGSSRWSDGDDQLIMARRGEGILVSEALDDYERRRLLALNAAAVSGTSPAQFRERFEHHALGGVVGAGVAAPTSRVNFRGHQFTMLFARVLQMAEQLSGAVFSITQGGFRPTTSYSGTSHRGDAVDIASPITTAVIAALRSVGVAAWDRTGKGNWMPHIHGVPTPGAGFAAGSAVWQAQDYLRGGDGLGGRDNGPRVSAGAFGGSINGETFGLLDIPSAIRDVVDGMKELDGPWGGMLRDAFTGMAERVKDWAMVQLGLDMDRSVSGGIGDKLPSRGYWQGTQSAASGLAWVGERGPELVNFRGGERVYNAGESAAMARAPHIENLTLALDARQVASFREFADIYEHLERLATQHNVSLVPTPIGG